MTTPLQESISELLLAGWEVLPLPKNSKAAPPLGSTGVSGVALEEEVLFEIADQDNVGNVGIRLPKTVIGLDFDLYKDGRVLQELQRELGLLPEAPAVSSRGVENGFTALFAVPADSRFETSAGTAVDIIQHDHRYTVAPPSIHPSGSKYSWVEWQGGQALPWIPEISDLPDLPSGWLDFLTIKEDKKTYDNTDEELILSGISCSTMRTITFKGIQQLRATTQRHDSMIRVVWAIVSAGAIGHSGGNTSLNMVLREWEKMFSENEKITRNIEAEFWASVEGAKMKVVRKEGSCYCGRKKKTYSKMPRLIY